MVEALSEARRFGHVHTLVFALLLATSFDQLTRSPMVHMEEMLALSAEHGFHYHFCFAQAFRGRSLLALGQAQEGFALLTQGLAELRAAGGVSGNASMLTWLAEAHAMLGQPADERRCQPRQFIACSAGFMPPLLLWVVTGGGPRRR
jgi:hypothetical protein